jgi:hypothetical protein
MSRLAEPPSSDLPHKLLPLRDFPAECCASYGPNHDFLLSGRPTPTDVGKGRCLLGREVARDRSWALARISARIGPLVSPRSVWLSRLATLEVGVLRPLAGRSMCTGGHLFHGGESGSIPLVSASQSPSPFGFLWLFELSPQRQGCKRPAERRGKLTILVDILESTTHGLRQKRR